MDEHGKKWVATASSSPGRYETNEETVITVQYQPPEAAAFTFRKFLAHVGPGFLMCIAYIDPGNLEADLQTGAFTGYSLLWLLLLSTLAGYLLQSLAAKLGVATGRHLAQHCRDRYPRPLRIILWLMAELAIIGSDIQEVIGTAIAVSLLSGGAVPLWAGVVGGAVAAYFFLFLEKFGVRWLEAFFQLLVGIMAVTMGLLFLLADVPYTEVVRGFLIPRLNAAALPTAAALIGSILMPHNLFLHSALVHNREVSSIHGTSSLRQTLRYYNLEAALALLVTLIINTSVITVFAKGFYDDKKNISEDIGLENAGQYLGRRFGKHAALIWAVGLFAAGQSSTMTGTYAGQYVMSGYLNLNIGSMYRALVTRAVAVGPTLLVALYARADSTRLDVFNQWLNILQAVQLPFAVVPLLALTSDPAVMGLGFTNSKSTAGISWSLAAVIMAVNCGTAYQVINQKLERSPLWHGVFITGVVMYIALVGFLLAETWWRRSMRTVSCRSAEEGGGGDGDGLVTPLLMNGDEHGDEHGGGGVRVASPARDFLLQRPESAAESRLSSHVILDDFDDSL